MKLRITSGGKTHEYMSRRDAASITIGRREGNDVIIDDPSISNLHLRIDRFLQTWTFTDQMSDSGTKHNGESKYSGDLNVGDVLQLGDVTVSVVDLDEADAEPVIKHDFQAASTSHNEFAFEALQTPAGRPPEPPRAAAPAQSPAAQTRVTSIPQDWQQEIRLQKPKPAGQRAGVAIAALVIMIFLGVSVYAWMFASEEMPESVPDYLTERGRGVVPERRAGETPDARPEPPPPGGRDQARRTEDAYKKELEALIKDEKTPPHERLTRVDEIKKEAADAGITGMTWPIERAQTSIGLQLSKEMQKRWGADNSGIYELRVTQQFRQAHERLDALAEYLAQSPYHKDWAKRHDMLDYIDEERPRIALLNERWIGERCSTADEALSRDDFDAAVIALNGLATRAVLSDAEIEAFNKEVAQHQSSAKEQGEGALPAPRKPFDTRKDRLPPAEPSDLLPQGEHSSLRGETRLRQRLLKHVQADDYDGGLRGRHHGRAATLIGYEGGNVTLTVQRPLPGIDDWSCDVNTQFHNLPGGTRASFYESLPELSRNERVGILMLCFDNGLTDEAARVACDLWKAHPEVKADLDKLLATKLRVELPEGGFVEKDGRLVVPE